jgi:hypothetical protein
MIRRPLLVLGALLVVSAVAVLGAFAVDRPATKAHRGVIVNAPRTLVWRLLTDFEGYRAWNPYIVAASGEARNGAELELRLDPLHEDPQDSTCDVITVKELRKLYWRCRDHHVPGLLDREHTFRVLPVDAEHVRLVYDGRWEGVLVPFVDLDDRKQGYRRMVDALKLRAERSS